MASMTRNILVGGFEEGGTKATAATLNPVFANGATTVSMGAMVGGAGVAAASSLIVSQLEYNGKKSDLADLYKKEIAAQLGKSEKKVDTDDLESVGQVNRVFGEELAQAKKERNVSIGAIFLATMGSVGAAIFLLPVGAGWLATTVVATLGYMVVKTPLEKLGKALFNIDEKSVSDRIEEISKEHETGKVISRERVFSVFVHANPKLDAFIENRYGKKFEKLTAAEKMAITESIGSQLGVARLADDINQGRIRATELAFAVDGKVSGVAATLGDEQKPGVMGAIKDKIHQAGEVFTGYHPADDRPDGFSFEQRERERRAAPKQTGVTA
jgi:hypothetical protein